MGRLSRGLALMLIVFGGLFAGFGQWQSVSQGPATTSFEAMRRFAAALDAQEMPVAASLGIKSISLVNADKRWGPAERAQLDYRVAAANAAAGRTANALALVRMASRELARGSDADAKLLIDISRLHGDLALEAGNKLEAACAYGLVLEALGPDRIAHPEQRLRPHPALEGLTAHLIGIGKTFIAAPAAPAADVILPLTSCNLTADFYAERKDFSAAASISDAVLAQAEHDQSLGPEIRAALLQDSARIAELNGQIDVAKARAAKAVDVLAGKDLGAPRVVALEALATLHTNWSDANGAKPYLREAINLRQKLNGPNSPELISPLIALGYAHLDTKDASGAESLFKRALSIADAKPVKNPSASLEATLALAELYDGEGRGNDAASMHSKAAALQKSGVTLRNADVEDVPIVEPSAKQRVAVFDIPYRAGKATGRIEVALSVPRSAEWAKAWPPGAFEPASETFADPLVYASRTSGPETTSTNANLFFVPGQGTSLSGSAARLARLQARLGPSEKAMLIAWTDGDTVTEGLRSDRTETSGARAVATALAQLAATSSPAPFTLVAEGRGAFVALSAIGQLSPAQRTAIDRRLSRLVLIAPDVDAPLLATALSHIDRSHTRTIIYPARTARPLLVASQIYGSRPIGLDPSQLSHFSGVETVEIGIGTDWTDFDTLWSDSLIDDMTSVIIDGTPASQRCAVRQMRNASESYVLNPSGCTLAAIN